MHSIPIPKALLFKNIEHQEKRSENRNTSHAEAGRHPAYGAGDKKRLTPQVKREKKDDKGLD